MLFIKSSDGQAGVSAAVLVTAGQRSKMTTVFSPQCIGPLWVLLELRQSEQLEQEGVCTTHQLSFLQKQGKASQQQGYK